VLRGLQQKLSGKFLLVIAIEYIDPGYRLNEVHSIPGKGNNSSHCCQAQANTETHADSDPTVDREPRLWRLNGTSVNLNTHLTYNSYVSNAWLYVSIGSILHFMVRW
jgi:hypothetical protein